MKPAPPIADFDAAARTEALTRAYAGWPPEGTTAGGAGGALVQAFAHLVDVVTERVNRIPEKNLLAFLKMTGARPAPPQTAKAPVTFRLAAGATADVVVPARTRISATAAPGEGEPPVFETDRDVVITATTLTSMQVRDPAEGRYADLGTGGAPFEAFAASTWIPQRLYLAHDGLLGLAESFDLRVRLEDPAGDARWPWLLRWERWDGAAWRAHASHVQRSGAVVETLLAGLPTTPPTAVAGRTGRWVRARLDTPFPRLGGTADSAATIRRTGIAPDGVIANGAAAVAGRPVTPFVTDKRLLIRSDEAFTKDGAAVTLTVRADPARPARPSNDLKLRWAWFDGRQWTPLTVVDTTKGLVTDGTVKLPVPGGWAEAPDRDGRWLLAEVATGGYGSSPPRLCAFELAYEWPRPRTKPPVLAAAVSRSGRRLDQAFANAVPVDLTKDFLPFGARPAAGDALYLACDDAFSPPRQSVSLEVKLTTLKTAGPEASPPPASPQHGLTLRWEYFDSGIGRWTAIGESGPGRDTSTSWALTDNTQAFTEEASIVFAPPATMGVVAVNGVSRRWLRVRVARGDYDATVNVPSATATTTTGTTSSTTVTAATVVRPQPPSLKGITATYAYASPALAAEAVAGESDFCTSPLAPDAGLLTPFRPSRDAEPTLYLGFDRPFSNQAVTLYASVSAGAAADGQVLRPVGAPPVVVWEYWDGEARDWVRLETRDETIGFTRRGLVTFVGPPGLAESVQLGRSAHWLRARWVSGRYARRPVLERVCTSTTWASHQTTILGEVLGSSTGRRGQVLRARRPPVLEGQALEVREHEEGPWVAWEEVVDFHGRGPQERCYVLTRATGEVAFGDGVQGRIPPRGRENVRMARYRTGGGVQGNRPAGSLTRLLSSVPYVDGVTNLEPAAGGVAAEDAGAFVERGPHALRHGGRAVVASDFEDLARSASVSVARASAVSQPGSVVLVVVPRGADARPVPTAELIERVEAHVRERTAATFDLWVAGPGWLRVDVEAEIVPTDIERATDVENAIQARLRAHLHPLTGNDGTGWRLGRRLFRSDLRSLLEREPGVEHVGTLRITESLTDPSPAPDAFLMYSGEHRIRAVGGD